jgi:hypothetical protein
MGSPQVANLKVRIHRSAVSIAAALLVASLATIGCKRKAEPTETAVPADRLTPQEQLPNEVRAFGIPMPRSLKLVQRFTDSVYLTGAGKVDELADYFRQYVDAGQVEIAGKRHIFPRATIKGDTSKRVYRIEITTVTPTRSTVKILDVTPPPFDPKLTEAQRWEQVGLNPDGTIKDRLKVY